MSNTRKAQTDAPFRQERYCSSAQIERGLMANLVALRCDALERPEDRELIYFLQLLSHREGGIKKVAADLIARFPENLVTASMRKFGFKPGKHYNAQQLRAIRSEMDLADGQFPLRGETPGDGDLSELLDDQDEEALGVAKLRAELHPTSYSAAEFVEFCHHYACEHLELALKKFCLDPAEPFDRDPLWYFADFIPCLRKYQVEWIDQRSAATVVTELGRLVYETLDFTLESKCMTLIDGFARTGKTFSAKSWCELHPGRDRYVQVPSTNDEIGFYRALAKSLGVSINLNSKAQELRQRSEEVLQRGDLAVIFDEAHYLWPNSSSRDVLPTRINWIMTALVNHGVGVSLVTTPQFLRTQKAMERKSCWTSEQFIGRIGHYQKLPDSLSVADLNRVAVSLLPEGDARALEYLVNYAQSSSKYLAGIESVVRRARYLAKKEERLKVTTADIRRAIKESVMPSDFALDLAISTSEKASRKRAANPMQGQLTGVEGPSPEAGAGQRRAETFASARAGLVADLNERAAGVNSRALVSA